MTDNERKELLLKAKPILFNTEMVRAILDGRKTVTRRVVKPQPAVLNSLVIPPYKVGDILYVRETWRIWKAHRYDADAFVDFRAGGYGTILRFTHGCTDLANRDDYDLFIRKWGVDGKWHPSIHMPKEAARIFLRVTNVRVERLQDITDDDCMAEGICSWSKDGKLYKYYLADEEGDYPACEWSECPKTPQAAMQRIWDSTIKKSDLDRYGWNANPFVWVITTNL